MGLTASKIPSFFGDDQIDILHFHKICSQEAALIEYELAHAVEKNVVIYDGVDRIRFFHDLIVLFMR